MPGLGNGGYVVRTRIKVPENENLTTNGCELDISKAAQVMLQLSPEEKMRRWPVVDVGSTERVYAKVF